MVPESIEHIVLDLEPAHAFLHVVLDLLEEANVLEESLLLAKGHGHVLVGALLVEQLNQRQFGDHSQRIPGSRVQEVGKWRAAIVGGTCAW